MIHYIYIPGLGDSFNPLRRFLLRRWRKYGDVSIVTMNWSNQTETWKQKCNRIVATVEELESQTIILVGESAGAAGALTVFAQHHKKIREVITVCGFNRGSKDIHAIREKHNPALKPMSQQAEKATERMPAEVRRRITTIYSVHDYVVRATYSRIAEAKEVTLRTPGHLVSIGYVLLRGPRAFHASARLTSHHTSRR